MTAIVGRFLLSDCEGAGSSLWHITFFRLLGTNGGCKTFGDSFLFL